VYKSHPSISGIEDNLQPGQPQLQLQLTEQGRALGMTTEMLAEQIFQGFSGQVVQRYQRNSDEIEVKVRYPEAERQNSTDLLNSSVRTSDGTVLPLTTVATVSYGYSRDSITRIDGKRAVYISADVDKDTVSATELVHTLKTTLTPALLANYPGLSIYFAGEAEQQAETQSSMIHVFLLAMLMIYMLLAIPLKSYIQPLLIMTAIPFGIVGAILGHWLNDLSLGILSLNGIIALSGVVVNDSLLLVSRFNTLRDEGLELHEAITEACRSRLRAVLLTSFTTFAGLMPLLGETSTQAQFLIPAAVSLAYGIMFATVITLILIPSLLMIQHDCKKLLSSVYRLYFPEKRQQQIC
jgi:multidrug efflux pump subunit AcrB